MYGKDKGISFNSSNISVPLDTLAQVGTSSKDALSKRARAKYFTVPLSVSLATLKSPLEKSYRNTFYCSDSLHQQGKKITGKYCNNRWCAVCNRIRTAKLINGYKRPLSELQNKYFITLTLPNCNGDELKETITKMNLVFDNIKELFKRRKQRKKQDWQLIGIRKLECTYNHLNNTFHPHFHFIIEGENASKSLLDEWLKRIPDANIKAQDIRPAAAGADVELFKYFTKIITKVGKGNFKTFIQPLDVIFQAMKGLRIFQPIGIKKDISEDIDELISEEIEDLDYSYIKWEWHGNDWIDTDTGEVLTGYLPSEAMEKIIQGITPPSVTESPPQ